MSANAIRSPSPFVAPIQTHRLCPTQCLLPSLHTSFPVHAHATNGLKSLVRENKHAPVVGLQVVDLLPEQQRPEVLADKFDAVERRLWPWSTGAEPVCPIRQIQFFEPWPASFKIPGPQKRHTYRSTNPCPTLYPIPSNRQNTASRFSSSTSPAPPAAVVLSVGAPPTDSVSAAGLLAAAALGVCTGWSWKIWLRA